MSRTEMARVLEALRASRLELQTLVDEDVHVPTGDLFEQLDESIELLEVTLAN